MNNQFENRRQFAKSVLAAGLAILAAGCSDPARESAPADGVKSAEVETSLAEQIPAPRAGDCESLADNALTNVEIHSAALQPAGEPIAGAVIPDFSGTGGGESLVSGLPAFCRVAGSLRPTADSNNRFEVWLPAEGWDGRFNGIYAGGLAGYINYPDLAAGIRAGQAVAATDSGHDAATPSSEWARGNPEKVRDYAWRGIHEMTVTGKALVNAYYGRGPDHSYFIGCSNGGRQAAMEASRFPEDYDGVLVGAPVAVFTDAVMNMANVVQAQLPEGAAIRPTQVPFLQAEVLAQCDGLDGQEDGLVMDSRDCALDYARLSCDQSDSEECFSEAQVIALQKIHAGPRDSSGKRLAHGLPPTGAEVGVPTFFGWEVNVAAGEKPPEERPRSGLADSILQDFVPEPIGSAATFDFDRDPARLKAVLGEELNASADMTRFFERGGKMILWHGWADAVLAPEATIAYYDDILARSGPGAEEHVRLFMVPGVQHCGAGPGPDGLGQVGAPMPSAPPERSLGAALQAWVEAGRVPEFIVGRHTGGTLSAAVSWDSRERLICAFPARAVLTAGEDPDKASSYVCQFGDKSQ